jgi:Peptidase family C25/Propeptide_C25
MSSRHTWFVIALLLLAGWLSPTTVFASPPPDAQVLAAFDELTAFIGSIPDGVMNKGQRQSFLAKLANARKQYLGGAICTADNVMGAFLNEARAQRKGARAGVAEDLTNRGRSLRDSFFDAFVADPSLLPPPCFDPTLRQAPQVTIETSDNTQFVATVKFGGPRLSTVFAGGETWTQLFLPAVQGQIGAPGLPALPSWQTLLAIPRDSSPLLAQGTATIRETLELNLYPFQSQAADQEPSDAPPRETFIDKPFVKDPGAYAANAFFPAEPCAVRLLGSMRDLHIVQVQCMVGQYNPVTDELRLFDSVRFDVRFQGGDGTFITSQSLSAFEKSSHAAMNSVLNREAVSLYVKLVDFVFECLGEELLILTHPNFRAAADTLATWKRSKGIATTVINVGSGTTNDTADKIDNLIQDRYDTCLTRVSYVLLLGDSEWVPPSRTDYNTSTEPDATTGSDWNYATYPHLALLFLDALFPYFAVGRIPVDSLTEANTVVSKIVQYESNPPFKGFGAGAPFYTTATVASYFQCCRTDVTQAGRDMRSFVETSETARNTLVNSGYSVQRIYTSNTDFATATVSDSTPRRFFDGDSLPSDLAPASGFGWNGTTTDIINAFNAGRFLVVHRDHGGPSQWVDPPFSTGNLGSLSNGALLPVVYSINCKSAYWDSETDGGGSTESIMEQLLLKSNGGMVSGIGDVRNSPTWPNSALMRGFIDATWPNLAPGFGSNVSKRRLGDILNHGKLYLATQIGVAQPAGDISVTDYTDEIILYHVIGDPTLEMWTSNPHALVLATDFALKLAEGGFFVEYLAEGAEITALQLLDDGSTRPIARGTVKNGLAALPFIASGLEQIDPKTLIISASLDNAVSVLLQDGSHGEPEID